MERTELIELVLRAHEVSFAITGPWDHEAEVTLTLPDLCSAPRSVWGDWGPMYTVSLSPDLAIEVSVRTDGNPEGSREALDLSHLTVESPMLAATRAVLPLVMELPLPKQQMRLRVFYDTQGYAARAELVPLAGGDRQVCAIVSERNRRGTHMTGMPGARPGYAHRFGAGAEHAAE